MRRMAGSLLAAVSVLLMAVTVLWVVVEAANAPDDLNEDQQLARAASLLFAGALLGLEVALFLAGRYLRQPMPAESARPTVVPRGRHPGLLAVYLGVGIAVALFAALLPRAPEFLRPLWFLVGQPFVLAQLLFGGLLGVKLGPDVRTQMIVVATNLLYFLAFLYPLYRMLTMDRAAEAVSYRHMRTLLILFVGVHMLIAAALAALVRA